MTQTVRVEGARELRRALKAAGEDLGDLKAANRAVAEIVAHVARSTAPRRSGRLAAAIRPSGTATRARVNVGGVRVPYAGPIHWGWTSRHIRSQPWVSKAAQDTETVWVEVYARRVDDVVDKLVDRQRAGL